MQLLWPLHRFFVRLQSACAVLILSAAERRLYVDNMIFSFWLPCAFFFQTVLGLYAGMWLHGCHENCYYYYYYYNYYYIFVFASAFAFAIDLGLICLCLSSVAATPCSELC